MSDRSHVRLVDDPDPRPPAPYDWERELDVVSAPALPTEFDRLLLGTWNDDEWVASDDGTWVRADHVDPRPPGRPRRLHPAPTLPPRPAPGSPATGDAPRLRSV